MKTCTTTFFCDTCGDGDPMTMQQMKEHVKAVHKHDGRLVGTQQAVEFIDGGNGYHYQKNAIKLECGVALTSVWEQVNK